MKTLFHIPLLSLKKVVKNTVYEKTGKTNRIGTGGGRMKRIHGISIFPGIAIGRIKYRGETGLAFSMKNEREMENEREASPETDFSDKEITVLEQAIEQAIAKENAFYQKALQETDKDSASIFAFHALILEDTELHKMLIREIRKGRSASSAVEIVFSAQLEHFSNIEDGYFRERKQDLADIQNVLLSCLRGIKEEAEDCIPFILMGEDLSPSDTMRYGKEEFLGFITREGSLYSHAAILSRSMGIPALVQCREVSSKMEGRLCILDGYSGVAYLDPDREVLAKFQVKKLEEEEKRKAMRALVHKHSISKDGKTIQVLANIADESGLELALENGADGIGLFRSEFLYMNRNAAPSEEEQFFLYKKLLEKMQGKESVVRVFDIGADKEVPYIAQEKEKNPGLGIRGIRLCLREKTLFKTQLRALLRASIYGNLSVLLPMISSIEEVRESKKLIKECKEELKREGKAFSEKFALGIMVEVPALIFILEDIASEVDFFSIGSNDLSQYLLAIDREIGNEKDLSLRHHPAVLKAIQEIVEKSHKIGISVGICGEMAADPELIPFYLSIGLEKLSVNVPSVLPLKGKILESESLKEE